MIGHGKTTVKRCIPCEHIVIDSSAVLVGFQTCRLDCRGTQHCVYIEYIGNRTFGICLSERIDDRLQTIAKPLF